MTGTELLSKNADEVLAAMERHRQLLHRLKKGGDTRLDRCLRKRMGVLAEDA